MHTRAHTHTHTHTHKHLESVWCHIVKRQGSLMDACFQTSLLNPRPELRAGDLSHTWMDLPPVVPPHLIFSPSLSLHGSIPIKYLAPAAQRLDIFNFFSACLLASPCSFSPLPIGRPPLPAYTVPPSVVHCGNWVRAVALESLCNPHFISTLIEVQIQYSLISLLLAVLLPAPLR